MDDPGPPGPCEPTSFAAQPVLSQLPPPVPPVTFEFSRIRTRRARAPNPNPKTRKTRHAPYPLPQPSLDGEAGFSPPGPPRTTAKPYRAPMNSLVLGMNRQTLHNEHAGQDRRAASAPHHDRMQELVREQSDMVMDVDPDEVETKEAPMPRSLEMMRTRPRWTRRGRPLGCPLRSTEDAKAPEPEQPSPTEPLLAHWHSPLEAGPAEGEAKEAPWVPTTRELKPMPLRRKHTRNGRPVTGPWHLSGDAEAPRPEEPSQTARHAQDTTTEPLPTSWHNQPPVVVDAVDGPACLEPDEGYCEGADHMSWLGEAGMLTDGLPTNGRLWFKTSAEAAMQCSVVVQKNPRMRRRRQRKMEARSRES
ncbi:hypothetical protein TOPH_05624 [Tolypocladium ophioglossoides CBS 100239]|uniref:Uncharacterized protein n=1 Tax=Tolypocladium ophioglossoides (strain CBS 100239) TaxID=1163406 RepID=A0A0L0N6Z6_TOLOC|nr:hypothetical protein TOPH_05624 [Tolypocladium ophioglossoides CBS 100239]